MKPSISALLVGIAALASSAGADMLWTSLDHDLWRIHSDASADAELSLRGLPEGSDHGAPALSPDESKVAIEVTGAGVWVCSLEGGVCDPLLGLPGTAARPTWNPKTGDLVFSMVRFEGGVEDADLWAVDPNLEHPRPLVTQTGNQDDPDVSPDGRTLVYASAQTVFLHQAAARVVSHLWMMDLLTGRASLLAPGPHQDMHPDWSPDGKRIAFASDRGGQFEIWVSSVDGGERRQVTSGDGSKSWPAWSPDGQSLVFTRLLNGRSTLMEVAATGSATPFAHPGLDADVQMRDPDWK